MSAFKQVCDLVASGVDENYEIICNLLKTHSDDIQVECPLKQLGRGESLLHIFAATPHLDYQLLFLGQKKIDVDVLNRIGGSPLHEACIYGNTKAVKLLLEHGANVNLCDLFDQTPLVLLCNSDQVNLDILNMLISAGANINYTYVNDWVTSNPLLAALYKYIRIDREVDTNVTFRELALSFIRTLLDAGADPGGVDDMWNTGLHIVCCKCNFDLAKMLIYYGANYHEKNRCGHSPLDLVHDQK